ncbi:MAG: hypothetical protein B7X02_03035 [Rhodospirillales bacterium 12-54-5]|nr:MAG: hypothetical protein B7X02_03035 [Rhodospirillales bacterium 12-54-5]
MKRWPRKGSSRALDIAGLDGLDTPGALFLCGLRDKGVELAGIRAEHRALLDLICGLDLKPIPKVKSIPRWRQFVIQIGKGAHDARHEAIDLVTFIGRTASWTMNALMHPQCLRLAAISRHVAETGMHALPIIGVMAIMMAVVLGYQGVAQLRPYGGEEFTVNLVAVSVLREMGVLITAIMVAGRSGSAFTAEIGVMKVREETDALKAIGIDPFELLVIPRLIALVIVMPVLTFIANMMGLLGGAILSLTLIGTSTSQYIDKVHEIAANGHALLVGLIKAPVFALFIGVVGCMHGMKVNGSAESVGEETTASVVQSIFMVLMLDAMFSIFFQQVGL